ncbi:MAG: segregation/condensation protein A [Candidatus Micrarchaeia archaeon]
MSIVLEEIVQRPTWKEILLDLIVKEELDPWDLDLVKISDAFLKKIKEMGRIELYIPANMILASAILLRCKSTILNFDEPAIADEPETEAGPFERPQIEEVTPLLRAIPKRPITVNELVEEIDNIIKYQEKKELIKKEKIDSILNLKIESESLEKKMELIYNMIVQNIKNERCAFFSRIVDGKKENKEVVFTLLSLLHLTQENRIDIEQKEFFGEIEIYALEKKEK